MSEEEKKEKEKPAAAAKDTSPEALAKAAGKKKTLIISAVVVLDLALMGGLAMFAVKRLAKPPVEDPAAAEEKKREAAEAKEKEAHTKIGHTLPKPLTFTVNIGKEGNEHYLKCSIQLEWEGNHVVGPDGAEEAPKEGGGGHGGGAPGALDPFGQGIVDRMPKVSDIIINILTSQPYDEVLRPGGKQRMKEAMVAELNAILPQEHGHLKGAYFTEFIVQ